MEWARILAHITGTVDQELLLRNEYLAAENRILKAQLKGRLRLSDAERAKLGEIGHRLGRKALGEVATAALPETILAVILTAWGIVSGYSPPCSRVSNRSPEPSMSGS
jgi:putative transposase